MPRLRKDPCPGCSSLKDKRASICSQCRFTYDHPRKGTGADRRLNPNGYITVMRNGESIYEHRLIMQEILNRTLNQNEHVHHKNGNRTDNRPENLEVLTSTEHGREHLPSSRAKSMSILGHMARWGHGG